MDLNSSKLNLTNTQTQSADTLNDGKQDTNNKVGHTRHVQVLLMFFCFATNYTLRVNMSVAIVSMTDSNSSNPDIEEFDWSELDKNTVLSSFFWGCMLGQIPAGELGQKFSPKILLLITTLISALLTCLTPKAAFLGGWELVSGLRLCQGVSQAFTSPLIYKILSNWIPADEHRLIAFALIGTLLGACAGLPLCGLLASTGVGWPLIFYVSCAICLTWSLAWALYGSDSPTNHRYITDRERTYIIENTVHLSHLKRYRTPWRKLLKSVPFWALIAVFLSSGWKTSMLITQIPSYINSVLKFNIQTNGLLSSLPFLVTFFLSFPICWFADYVKKKNLLTDEVIMKLWASISQTGSVLLLLSVGFVDGDNAPTAVLLLTLTVVLAAFQFSGLDLNALELAPNFAGLLTGIANTFENIGTLLAPLAVGWVLSDPPTISDWRLTFVISACIVITGNLLFVIFGTTKIQPWNNVQAEK